jgi:hypothetical protein
LVIAMTTTDADEDRLLAIAEHTLQVARPLLWHDPRTPWPKVLAGASCFILRFPDGLVGVTANHVIVALELEQRQTNRLVCLLRTTVVNLPEVIIDRSPSLDIATFSVTEQQLMESGAVEIDCSGEWPPPTPRPQDALSLAGYPEELKIAAPHDQYTFHGYVHTAIVEDVTEHNIIAVYNPERGDWRARAAALLPDLGANFSGCSGGPVLLHLERNCLHRWFPVGLILGGPRGGGEGLFAGLDVFHFRRIDFIQPDGSIKAPC